MKEPVTDDVMDLLGRMSRGEPGALDRLMPMVYASGVVEIAAALAILAPAWRRPVGIFLIAMLLGFLPVNVYAAFARVEMGGHAWGPVYLLIRVPLQAMIAGWIWWFTVRQTTNASTTLAGTDH